jgi:thymidine phosphorylase
MAGNGWAGFAVASIASRGFGSAGGTVMVKITKLPMSCFQQGPGASVR